MAALMRRRCVIIGLGIAPVAAAQFGSTAARSSVHDYWRGKKIAWFGTSIPANPGPEGTYPDIVGRLLEATVVNEAVGSSIARNGVASRVDEASGDRCGWTGLAWQNIAWNLSGSVEEKTDLIDRWEFWRERLRNSPPERLAPAFQKKIIETSWEIKLKRHLGEGVRADLYVFDHGHNDWAVSPLDVAVMPPDGRHRGYFLGAMNSTLR